MVGRILIPEIKSMIDARRFGALRELFEDWPPADVAEVILDMEEHDQVIIFRVLPHDLAADVFEYLDVEAQQLLLRMGRRCWEELPSAAGYIRDRTTSESACKLHSPRATSRLRATACPIRLSPDRCRWR
jgi:magnesium transporter